MSEFSESLHFRHALHSEQALHEALRASDVSGALIPVSSRWATFVPFESDGEDREPERTNGARLSRAVGAPVLEYHFAEDFYWGFFIWSEGVLASQYACAFRSRASRIVDSEYDSSWLGMLLPEETSLDALATVLYPPKRSGSATRAAGKKFIELMQLGDVEWLGPLTVEERLLEIGDNAGVLVLGSPPPAPVALRIPSQTKSFAPIELHGTALTARDALGMLKPMALEWSPDASLIQVMSSILAGAPDERHISGPWINEDGRTSASGGWYLLFHSAARAQYLSLSVIVSTSQLVRIDDSGGHHIRGGTIAAGWLDSTDVLRLTEPLYLAWRTADSPTVQDRILQLLQTDQGPRWHVLYLCAQRGYTRRDLDITLDALTGEITRTE